MDSVISPWPFTAAMFVGMLICVEIGRRIGLRHLARDPELMSSHNSVDSAVFALYGLLLTLARLIRVLLGLSLERYEKARLTLARFLALALEFQLAADVLSTAIAPSWTAIGKLGAIAVIRTALNYFLGREIKEEERSAKGIPEPEAAA